MRLSSGEEIAAAPGDWIVANQRTLLAVVPARTFPAPYELVDPAALTLSNADRTALESTLGLGATQTPAALVAAVSRLARLRVGEVEITFTPGQLEELAHRAEKRGRSLQAEIEAVVDRIREEIFWRS